MPKKKNPKKFPLLTEKSPQEQVLYIGGLLENVETSVKMIAENQLQMEERLTSRAEAIRDELKQDIHFTQLAVKSNKEEILVLQEDVKRLEQKMDRVVDKVDRHDEEIAQLKSAAI